MNIDILESILQDERTWEEITKKQCTNLILSRFFISSHRFAVPPPLGKEGKLYLQLGV